MQEIFRGVIHPIHKAFSKMRPFWSDINIISLVNRAPIEQGGYQRRIAGDVAGVGCGAE